MSHRFLPCVIALACSGSREAPVVPSAAVTFAETFAPELVGTLVPTAPRAGDYAMALASSFDTTPSMEMRITTRRTGALRMSLVGDGTVHACLGARSSDITAGQYHYEPPERRQYRADEQVQLLSLSGTWTIVGDIALVRFDHQRWGTCDVAAMIKMDKPVAELRCIGTGRTKLVPAPGLACEASESSLLLELGVPLTAASRKVSPSPIHPTPSGRNLLLGVPGVLVDVTQGSQAMTPTITFRSGTVTLVEDDYRPTARKPKG